MKRALAVAFLALVMAGPAVAETIIAKDGSGRMYRLNEDGTYELLATAEDGRTFILDEDGMWFDLDGDATLARRFLAEFDKALNGPNPPPVDDSARETVRDCMVAAFNALPRAGRRMLLATADIRENFERFERAYPEAAKLLNAADRACRKGPGDN